MLYCYINLTAYAVINDEDENDMHMDSEDAENYPTQPLLDSLNNSRPDIDEYVQEEVIIDSETSTPSSLSQVNVIEGPCQDENKHLDADQSINKDDEGQLCPICLDNWTSTGEHRICALKCGHLFGYSCIIRWLSAQNDKSCPTCKKKTVRSDIRFIYARKLIVVDNSELEDVKKELNKVTVERNKIQIELTKAICREHSIKLKVEELQKNVEYLDKALEVKRQFGSSSPAISGYSTLRLYLDKSLEICPEAGCRVLDSFNRHDLIVASTKSTNALFPGFGVRKINIGNYKPFGYVALHSKSIRDIKFNADNPWLLSVSLDKTAKIVDTNSGQPVCIYTAETPLWSCCWDSNNPNLLYIGQQQGSVIKVDIRQTNKPVCTLEVPADMSPVVSVSSIPVHTNKAIPNGGVISCKLNSMWTFGREGEEYARSSIPLDGPFISMTYESKIQQLLVSTRPNSNFSYSRHHLCNFENVQSNLVCNTIHCIKGSTVQKFLSRSCFITHNSNYYIAAHQESDRTLSLWDVKTGNQICSTSAQEPVLDVCGIEMNNLVVSLTDKKIMFYKFT